MERKKVKPQNNRKRRLALLSAFFPAWLVKAFWQICLCIMIILVGAYIVIKLYDLCKTLWPDPPPPPPGQTNAVPPAHASIYVTSNQWYWTSWFGWCGNANLRSSTNFTLHFGVASSSLPLPWLAVNSDNVPTNTFAGLLDDGDGATYSDCVVYTYYNDDSGFNCLFVQPDGTLGQLSCSTNADDNGTVTTISLVVDRSTNLVVWTPIYTNMLPTYDINNNYVGTPGCVLDQNYTYTDTNSPPDCGFYRIRYLESVNLDGYVPQ